MACRGVLRPPYAGARGLIEWAVDLWPYVNGKALLSGVNLKEIDAMDMLDVVHVFFEEDLLSPSSKEEGEARNKGRAVIYREFYQKTYRYGVTSSSESYNYDTASDGFIGDTDDVEDPLKTPTKPFTPSTDFNPDSPLPFGNTLDAPIG